MKHKKASQEPQNTLTDNQTFEAFKFYEEAAEKTKGHAWTQTTWILALNSGILAFSIDFYSKHADLPGVRYIEFVSTSIGLILCGFLFYLIGELGKHIRNYWTSSNKMAAKYPPLTPFIGQEDAIKAKNVCYRASFPRFCRRLQLLTILFAAVHIICLALILSLPASSMTPVAK